MTKPTILKRAVCEYPRCECELPCDICSVDANDQPCEGGE